MRFWILFIIFLALLAFLAQILSKFHLITRKMRIYIGIFFLLIATSIGIFTFFQDQKEDKINELAQLFLQGKNLVCQIGAQNIETNRTTFNFISGTLTLMGKENSDYHGKTIPLKSCKLNNAESH